MKNILMIIWALVFTTGAFAQQQKFEETYSTDEDTERPRVRVGADFSMQFQGLKHRADTARLIPLGKNITLPTANFNIEADLTPGVVVNLTTYLSSRHHNDAWVKGGYLLIDELPFLNSPAVDNIMEYLTLKAGVMEINYGDAHFRRSDNGRAITNPFVGNYIMDAFTTAPALELLFNANGFMFMGAITTGTLKPELTGYSATSKQYTAYNAGKELAYYAKVGYDKEINENLRVRATISGYHSPKHHFGSLYYGDRAGSRFYLVMQRATNSPADVDQTSNFLTGNWGPGPTNKNNALMANLFLRFHGAEFFGTVENAKGTGLSGAEFDYKQFAAEGLYRFGKNEQFFTGVKYNAVKNQTTSTVNRMEVGAGWFPLKNIVIKAEYVDQNYKNFDVYGGGAGFNGIMVESAISF